MDWLNILAIVSLALSAICSLVIVLDIVAGHRQKMAIMNVVWPITALYAGPLGLAAYFWLGRKNAKDASGAGEKPFWQSVALAATHCGSGCTLGDILVESFLIAVPLTLFGREIYAAWGLDYVVAFAIGIAFQYFTIVPMKNLSPGAGLKAAVKADALSLTAWQVGMYGWMAVATFVIFRHPLEKTGPLFWFMMQVAMLAGFLTAYPVNWWLVRSGVKEKM
jgi:hypothetical protein